MSTTEQQRYWLRCFRDKWRARLQRREAHSTMDDIGDFNTELDLYREFADIVELWPEGNDYPASSSDHA